MKIPQLYWGIIIAKSKKAADRIMGNITRYIESKLRLKVNREKSKVDRPWRIKYLGFSFYQAKGKIEIRVHPKSIARFKDKILHRLHRIPPKRIRP